MGDLRLRDVIGILPNADQVVLVQATGRVILQALENSVSMYPATEGRFLQVSGVVFSFDPSQASGSRVVQSSVLIGGKPLEPEREYRVSMREYIRQGHVCDRPQRESCGLQ